jgi:hypothetical protein
VGPKKELGGVESVGTVGAIGVKVAVECIHRGFENQTAVGAGFQVAPDFRLDGRGQATFQVPAD